MRRVNALCAGLLGGAVGPLLGLAELAVMTAGARPAINLGAALVAGLVLAIAGFSVGVLLAALWNTVIDGR